MMSFADFGDRIDPRGRKRLDILQRCTEISNLVVRFILNLTSPNISRFLTIPGIVRYVLVGWGRTIVTAVLFGDVFVRSC